MTACVLVGSVAAAMALFFRNNGMRAGYDSPTGQVRSLCSRQGSQCVGVRCSTLLLAEHNRASVRSRGASNVTARTYRFPPASSPWAQICALTGAMGKRRRASPSGRRVGAVTVCGHAATPGGDR